LNASIEVNLKISDAIALAHPPLHTDSRTSPASPV
jgi:hypothetical protein